MSSTRISASASQRGAIRWRKLTSGMEYPEFQAKVAERIKSLRIEKDMTQEEVSGLDIANRAYQAIERGENAPSLKSIFLIARALGVEPMELLNLPAHSPKKKK